MSDERMVYYRVGSNYRGGTQRAQRKVADPIPRSNEVLGVLCVLCGEIPRLMCEVLLVEPGTRVRGSAGAERLHDAARFEAAADKMCVQASEFAAIADWRA